MTKGPSAGKPGGHGARADEDARTTLLAIGRWKQAAADEVDNIGTWRDADSGDRLHKFWSDPARQKNAEHGSTMPRMFYTDTTHLLGWVASHHQKLDPTPLQDVYEAISAWHTDHSAERLPEQRVLLQKLDRAMQVVQAVEDQLVRAARQSNGDSVSQWESDRDRLRYLVTEMRHRITAASSWGRLSAIYQLQDEAGVLALRLGFPGEPLRLVRNREADSDFIKWVPSDVPDAVDVLRYVWNGPLGEFAVGVIGCTRPGEINGKPGLIEVDFTFDTWKPETVAGLQAWERAIDGMVPPRGPRPTGVISPDSGNWSAALKWGGRESRGTRWNAGPQTRRLDQGRTALSGEQGRADPRCLQVRHDSGASQGEGGTQGRRRSPPQVLKSGSQEAHRRGGWRHVPEQGRNRRGLARVARFQ